MECKTQIKIAGYDIIRLLGKGGMGEVYLALQKDLNRHVAIKIIENNHREAFERFKRESQIAAALQHPNIINIYSIGEAENFFYIVMEYVHGRPISDILQEGAIPEIEVWKNIALPVCEALQEGYEKGFIHRDIKPDNLMIDIGGRVKLMDFGLSKSLNEDTNLTSVGTVLGTANYMSPEQASGKELDCRSDIYSLGATIYYLITGRPIFEASSFIDMLLMHKSSPIEPPQKYTPDIKPDSSLVIAHMLSKEKENRYQNYYELIADIKALLENVPVTFASHSSLKIYTYNPIKKRSHSQRIYSWLVGNNKKTTPTGINLKSSISSRIVVALEEQETKEKKTASFKPHEATIVMSPNEFFGEDAFIKEPLQKQDTLQERPDEIRVDTNELIDVVDVTLEKEHILSEEDNKIFIENANGFYEHIKPLLLKVSSEAFLAACHIKNYLVVPLKGENLPGEEIFSHIRNLVDITTKLSWEKEDGFLEGFSQNFYFGLIWNQSKEIVFLYMDMFKDISKVSWYRNNVATIYKQLKN